MLETLEGFPDNVLALRAHGNVTAEDYREVLVPGVEARLAEHRRMRLLYVLGEEFERFTGGAAWEDAKVGLRHFVDFERVAVVSDEEWVRRMVRGFGFALPGEVRVFDLAGFETAADWIRMPVAPVDP